MRALLRLLPIRNLRRQPLRGVLTVIGAACGVALFVSIEIIAAATMRYFADGVRAMAGGAALTVSASEAGFFEAEREKVESLPGVRAVVPSLQTLAYVRRPGRAEPEPIGVLGIDPKRESHVRMHRLRGSSAGPATLDALLHANSILLPEGASMISPAGDPRWIEVMTQSGVARLEVAGVLASVGGESGFAVVALATAQQLFGFAGRITRLDVVVDQGHDIDALAQTMRGILGPAFTVASSHARATDVQRIVRSYQATLRFVSLIALLAGAMVLAVTMGISAREQRRSIGVLRALGAARSTILVLLATEAAVLAGLAVILGVSGGRLVAELLVDTMTRAMARTYMIPIHPTALQYPVDRAVLHASVAWLIGVLAAVVAALRVARVEPVQAMQPGDIQSDIRSPRWIAWASVVGGALAAYLIVVLATRADVDAQRWQTANAGLGLVAALLLAPMVVVGALRLLRGTHFGQGLVDRSIVLRLSMGSIVRAPARSAWSVLLLSIGLLMFVTLDTLRHSLLTSVEGWIDRTVFSDLLIAAPGSLFNMEVQPLNEALARDIDATPGVRVDDGRGAMGVRYASIPYAGREITLKAFDRPHASLTRLPFDLRTDYTLHRGGDIFACERARVLVSENFVKHFGKRPGDELTLESPAGPLRADIVGVVTDYASPDGVVYLARDLYRAYWHDPLVSVFSVVVQPGVDPRQVADAIDATLGREKGLRTTNQRELRQQSHDILNESFAYTYAIEGAILAAAIFGIMNSTIGAVLARQRELAVLRAIGMSRIAVFRMIVSEGVWLAVPAGVAAVVLGSLLAYLCLAGVVSALMGWTLEFRVSPWMPVIALSIAAISGCAASAIAAWKSANVELTESLIAY